MDSKIDRFSMQYQRAKLKVESTELQGAQNSRFTMDDFFHLTLVPLFSSSIFNLNIGFLSKLRKLRIVVYTYVSLQLRM